MAEGQTPTGSDYSESPIDLKNPTTPSSRTRRKLGRTSSKAWMNKSFDQSALSQSGSSVYKPMRRQSSASDFFQSVLTKSRSHLLSLFSTVKKDNTRQTNRNINERVSPSRDMSSRQSFPTDKVGIQYAVPKTRMTKASSFNALPKSALSSDNLPTKSDFLSSHHQPKSRDSLQRDGSSIASMFIVTNASDQPGRRGTYCGSVHSHEEEEEDPYNNPKHATKIVFHSDSTDSLPLSSSASEPSRVSTSVVDFPSTNGEDNDHNGKQAAFPPRQISSAPLARQRLSIESSYLKTGYENSGSVAKRALVKSNSDTLARLSQDPSPIVKASSDGNCFKNDPAIKPLLPTSASATNSALTRITDYLFLGSVEAAYSEPLLCKYKISSLIDITNLSPRLIPISKKTDCPCTCVNKHHFRSKLNIGVDDIEWENLEQYFREINAFIDGTRKKKGKTLIFSYMGQSRAPAAVIQHLMHHYDMSYREALSIVESKRQQIKINPGFVKTLKRLELRLAMTKEEKPRDKAAPSPIPYLDETQKGGEERDKRLSPPVVRGAWLEC